MAKLHTAHFYNTYAWCVFILSQCLLEWKISHNPLLPVLWQQSCRKCLEIPGNSTHIHIKELINETVVEKHMNIQS